jgi:tape measure domain-containing protein
MSSIDNRVVSMTFDNRQFERSMAETLSSLNDLSRGLQMVGAIEGLSGINQAAEKVNLSGIETALDNISSKFSVMGAIGFAAIQKLTHAAMDFAVSVGQKALGPLLGGGKLRAENIEQAKFLFRGLGMDIDDSMKSALDAVQGTAYGLDVAAKTAAQFGGSGMKAGAEMTGALRAVAGVAAMTNTSYEEMADVFTSAAGKGKVSGYELQRIGQRGLNAAAALGKQWGKTEQEVRKMATEGEISFEMFAKGMDDAFGEHATKANETYTGSLANMRAALSRMGASFFGPHMLQQRDLFNALTPVIDNVHKAVKPLINTLIYLKGIGIGKMIAGLEGINLTVFSMGLEYVTKGVVNLYNVVQDFVAVAKLAFREIFPKKGPEESFFLSLTRAFAKFTEALRAGSTTLESVKSIFRGVFSAIAIGIEIVKGIVSVFFDLFKVMTRNVSGGGILGFFANLGESLVDLKTKLVDGGGIANFFDRISKAIRNPAAALDFLKEKLSGLFSGDAIPGAGVAMSLMDRIRDRAGLFADAARGVGDAWGWLSDRFKGIRSALSTVWGWISSWFSELKDKLAAVFTASDFNPVLDAVNIGLLGGIALLIRKWMQNGFNFNFDFSGGMIKGIKGMFSGLTETLSAMQAELKAKALKQIAIAIAILTASIVVLSMIDPEALTKALLAISVGLGQLMATLWALDKMSIGTGMARVAASLILVSVAVLILSAAIKNLSGLGWEEMAKGLIGVAGGLAVLVIGMNGLNANQAGLVRAGIAMGIIAAALYILSIAVKAFAEMSWGEMLQGLVGVYAGLIAIGTAMKFMPEKRMMAQGVALILIATGLRILANAVQAFGDIPFGEMVKGLAGIGAGLVIIAGGMHLMPKGMILQGAGLILVATGLRILAEAVQAMGNIAFGEMAKGIGGLAATLAILAIGLNLMVGTAGGAAAVLIAAVALGAMVQVVKAFGKMKLEELAIGLGAIAAVFVVLGLGALVLAPVVPVLFSLGVALGLIGGAFALFGVGAMLVAKSFEVLAKVGLKSAKIFVEALKLIVAALPEVLTALAEAVLKMALTFIQAAPVLVVAIGVLIGHILDTLQELIPKFIETIAVLVVSLLDYIRSVFPEFVTTGFEMLMAILTGLRDNMFEIVTVVAEIITEFLDALALKVPELIDSVYNLLVAVFLGVVAKLVSIGEVLAPRGRELLGGLLTGVSNKVIDVIRWFNELPLKIVGWIGDVSKRLLQKGIDLISGLFQGITDKFRDVWTWLTNLPADVLRGVGDLIDTFKGKGHDLIWGFLDGITNKYKEVWSWLFGLWGDVRRAVGNLATALLNAGRDLIQGLWNGAKEKWDQFTGWLSNLNPANWFNDINPYKGHAIQNLVTTGGAVMQGLWNGMQDGWENVTDWLNDLDPSNSFNDNALRNMNAIFDEMAEHLSDLDDFNPVITPVLNLDQVEMEAKNLQRLVSASSISPNLSLVQARHISSATAASRTSDDLVSTNAGPTEIKFEQTINAPTPLSTNDIYRATRNQITLAKEELDIL